MQCVSAKASVILNQISVVCHSERNASLLSHTHLSLFHTINLNAQWSILFVKVHVSRSDRKAQGCIVGQVKVKHWGFWSLYSVTFRRDAFGIGRRSGGDRVGPYLSDGALGCRSCPGPDPQPQCCDWGTCVNTDSCGVPAPPSPPQTPPLSHTRRPQSPAGSRCHPGNCLPCARLLLVTAPAG